MAVQADQQRDDRSVDELEPQVATDDIIDTALERPGLPDDMLQDDLGQQATQSAQQEDRQQVGHAHPLPRFKSKGLEDR